MAIYFTSQTVPTHALYIHSLSLYDMYIPWLVLIIIAMQIPWVSFLLVLIYVFLCLYCIYRLS